LPAEIANETDPAKIAAFYQRAAEAALRTQQEQYEARLTEARQPAPAAPVESREPSSADYYSDPRKAVTDQIKGMNLVTQEQFNTLTQGLQQSAIVAAKMGAREGKEYWARFEREISEVMRPIPPHQQAQPAMWETAYDMVVGKHAKELYEEGKRMGAQPPAESTTPGFTPVEPEKTELNAEQKEVAKRLSRTEEQYKRGLKRVAEGAFPMESLRRP